MSRRTHAFDHRVRAAIPLGNEQDAASRPSPNLEPLVWARQLDPRNHDSVADS
jgi:hypothetical protein